MSTSPTPFQATALPGCSVSACWYSASAGRNWRRWKYSRPRLSRAREERLARRRALPGRRRSRLRRRPRAPGPRPGCSRRADRRGPPRRPARRTRPPPPAGPPGGGTLRARSTAWAVGILPHQPLVELERGAQIAPEQVHLGHRLEVEPAVLPGLERQAIFAQRLVVIALLPEGEPEIEVRERTRRAPAAGAGVARSRRPRASPGPAVVAVERQIRLRAGQRRVERDGALGRVPRRLVLPQVAVDEGEQVVRLGVVRVPARSLPSARPAPARSVPGCTAPRRSRSGRPRSAGPPGRPARARRSPGRAGPRAFSASAELDHGRDIVGMPRQEGVELRDRLRVPPERRVDRASSQRPSRSSGRSRTRSRSSVMRRS